MDSLWLKGNEKHIGEGRREGKGIKLEREKVKGEDRGIWEEKTGK